MASSWQKKPPTRLGQTAGCAIYAALNDASYNGEGTLLFDAATDTPSAA